MRKQYLTIAILALSAQFASAQLTLSGEFRPRAEIKGNGVSSSAAEDSSPFLQTTARAALNAKYKAETYTLYLGFQEVFEFGDRTQISAANNGNFRVQEAWADLKLTDELSFKLGRQPLSYDDQRILGGLGWAQQARTHDVGVLKYKGKDNGFKLDGGYAINTDGDGIYDTATLFSYDQLGFIHANKNFGKVSLSGLVLGTIYQAGTENKSGLITAGIHAKAKFGKLGLTANAYIQDGERVGDVAVESATLLSLDATYGITDKVSVTAGIESISGRDDDSAAFFPLYGTNHKFNGLMDRFYVGNHANAGGLVDIHLGGKFNLGSGFNLMVKGHNFTEQSLDKETLGQEIDLVLAKKFKQYKLVVGYSHFIESDYYEGNYGAYEADDLQNWAWAMLIIKPKFLGGAKKKMAPKKM